MKVGAGSLQIQINQGLKPVEKIEPSQKGDNEELNITDSGVIQQKVVRGELIKAVERLNDSAKLFNRQIKFEMHEETKRVMVKVMDENGEIKTEIPSEKILDMIAEMEKSMGMIVDRYI